MRDHVRTYCHLGGGRMEDFYETPAEDAAAVRRPGPAGGRRRLHRVQVDGRAADDADRGPAADPRRRGMPSPRCARRSATTIDIMVDCHARPSPAMGLQFAKALEPYGLYFFEEPCWPESVDGLAAINAAVTTPIATGERVTNLAAFRDLFAARACDICQLDITHCGGFTEARRIAALAEAHRIALAPHNPQGPVSTAASLEFGFSQPSYIICETVHADVPWRQDVVAGRLHRREAGPHRAAQHAAGPGHHDQRGRSEEASVPAGAAAARVSIATAAWGIGSWLTALVHQFLP